MLSSPLLARRRESYPAPGANSGEVNGQPLSTAVEVRLWGVLFRRGRFLCLGAGTHVSCKGSLAVSGNVRAATMPARAAAMR